MFGSFAPVELTAKSSIQEITNSLSGIFFGVINDQIKKVITGIFNSPKYTVNFNSSIYNSLTCYNFGNALLEADNALFEELEDENFLPIDESDPDDDEDYVHYNKSYYYEKPDYESDYFNAMTDGQLGDYNDFRENGGYIDDIDTWARG